MPNQWTLNLCDRSLSRFLMVHCSSVPRLLYSPPPIPFSASHRGKSEAEGLSALVPSQIQENIALGNPCPRPHHAFPRYEGSTEAKLARENSHEATNIPPRAYHSRTLRSRFPHSITTPRGLKSCHVPAPHWTKPSHPSPTSHHGASRRWRGSMLSLGGSTFNSRLRVASTVDR